jgi:hypothetical protein
MQSRERGKGREMNKVACPSLVRLSSLHCMVRNHKTSRATVRTTHLALQSNHWLVAPTPSLLLTFVLLTFELLHLQLRSIWSDFFHSPFHFNSCVSRSRQIPRIPFFTHKLQAQRQVSTKVRFFGRLFRMLLHTWNSGGRQVSRSKCQPLLQFSKPFFPYRTKPKPDKPADSLFCLCASGRPISETSATLQATAERFLLPHRQLSTPTSAARHSTRFSGFD